MRIFLTFISCTMMILAIGQDEIGIAHKMYDDGDFESVILFVHSFEIRHAEDLLLEADAYHKMGEYSEAVETYTQSLAREENNARALMRRGAAYLEMGEFGFALKDVKKALRLWPEHPEASFHMGNICYDQGDMKNAVKYYKKAIYYRPGYPQATYMLGAAKSELGHNKDAARAFEEVIGEYPGAKYNLAVVRLEESRYEDALGLFNEVESAGLTHSADLYFFRAESHYFLGDKHAACLDYRSAKDLGDEESAEIYDSFCMKSRKKEARKKRGVERIDL